MVYLPSYLGRFGENLTLGVLYMIECVGGCWVEYFFVDDFGFSVKQDSIFVNGCFVIK